MAVCAIPVFTTFIFTVRIDHGRSEVVVRAVRKQGKRDVPKCPAEHSNQGCKTEVVPPSMMGVRGWQRCDGNGRNGGDEHWLEVADGTEVIGQVIEGGVPASLKRCI